MVSVLAQSIKTEARSHLNNSVRDLAGNKYQAVITVGNYVDV